MRQRWKVVLVDEFQDTDPVQWEVLDRAFTGHATLILIGDPKQAIYAFRGGDVVAYLRGRRHGRDPQDPGHQLAQRRTAGRRAAEAEPGRRAGRPADHGPRRRGAPPGQPAGRRSRARRRCGCGSSGRRTSRPAATAPSASTPLREHIAVDLAADVARLLGSGATFEGRPIEAGDVALLISSVKRVDAIRSALAAPRHPLGGRAAAAT